MIYRSRNFPHAVRVADCAHLQCDRPRWRQQLCRTHFRRLEAGSSIANPVRGQRPWCLEIGCYEPQLRRRSLCLKHYREVVSPRPEPIDVCTLDGCEGQHVAFGLCRRHYDQNRRGRQFSATPDVDTIALDLDLGIGREAILADLRMDQTGLSKWLLAQGRLDLVERLRAA